MENYMTPVYLYCPNCGHKVMGYKTPDGAVKILCDRCRSVIFSKKMKQKEVTLKIVAPQTI